MSKKSPVLIYNVEGNVGSCFECPKDKKKPVAYVVHHNFMPVSKDDKKEFKGIRSKGMERFLCNDCFEINWKNNPMRHTHGLSEFTFVKVADWKKLSYQHK